MSSNANHKISAKSEPARSASVGPPSPMNQSIDDHGVPRQRDKDESEQSNKRPRLPIDEAPVMMGPPPVPSPEEHKKADTPHPPPKPFGLADTSPSRTTPIPEDEAKVSSESRPLQQESQIGNPTSNEQASIALAAAVKLVQPAQSSAQQTTTTTGQSDTADKPGEPASTSQAVTVGTVTAGNVAALNQTVAAGPRPGVAPAAYAQNVTLLPTYQPPQQVQPTAAMINYASFPGFQLQPTDASSIPVAPTNVMNHHATTAAHFMAMAAAAGISQQQQAMSLPNVYMSQPPQQFLPTQAQPAAQHLAALTGMGHTGGRRGPLLYIPTDNEVLSDNQILLRKQIEFFEAALDDVGKTTSGRRRPIMLSQVGIQCRHCGGIPSRYRQKGAIYYPAKLAGIYQAAQNMAVTHLTNLCQHIDEETKQHLKEYQEGRSITGHGGKQYWAGTAKAQCVVESDEGGLRFGAPSSTSP